MSVVLETFSLCRNFSGIVATNNVSLRIDAGARHALIGPNGAGKTTLINLLTGVLAPSSGRIALEGEDITALPPHRRVRKGLVRTFQICQLFPHLTPLETVSIGVSERHGLGRRFWNALGRRGEVMDESEALLEKFRLADIMHQRAGTLPYGKRRLMEIALALAARPRVLLLDEPVAGVPETERDEILETMAALPDSVTIVLIEHDMDIVFNFAKRMSVLVNGALFAEGTPAEIAHDPRIKAVYLGEDPVPGHTHHG